jgi:phosphopantothenoylcysteine decarboxylase/phosphopantothenate--cysteine ligase
MTPGPVSIASSATTRTPLRRGGRVLLGVSGGIAAFKAPLLVRELQRQGFEVRCALTENGARFVAPLTLEVLSQHPVLREEYLQDGGRGEELHLTVSRWADLLCLAPATANLLSRSAHGIASDFLTTVVTMFEGPVVVAPAMHSAMWSKPAVRSAVALLEQRGVHIVGPESGPLASGESGPGRMAAIDEIAEAIEGALTPKDYQGLRVLVTAGPTHEPLDPVRYLANRSSGRMGFALASQAQRRGASVTLIAGPVHLSTPRGVERIDVESAAEMAGAVERVSGVQDLIVMAAAVADYGAIASAQKRKKSGRELSLQLTENVDILASLPAQAPAAVRVGFAAETEGLLRHAQIKLERKGADFIVANDVSRADIGFGSDENEAVVLRRRGDPVPLAKATKREIASQLLDLFLPEVRRRVGEISAPEAIRS